jgi:hypothetical protein
MIRRITYVDYGTAALRKEMGCIDDTLGENEDGRLLIQLIAFIIIQGHKICQRKGYTHTADNLTGGSTSA